MTVSAGGPIFCFCCFIEVTMTGVEVTELSTNKQHTLSVVKSVSDGLRDCES
jgi:hypothetical protein